MQEGVCTSHGLPGALNSVLLSFYGNMTKACTNVSKYDQAESLCSKVDRPGGESRKACVLTAFFLISLCNIPPSRIWGRISLGEEGFMTYQTGKGTEFLYGK